MAWKPTWESELVRTWEHSGRVCLLVHFSAFVVATRYNISVRSFQPCGKFEVLHEWFINDTKYHLKRIYLNMYSSLSRAVFVDIWFYSLLKKFCFRRYSEKLLIRKKRVSLAHKIPWCNVKPKKQDCKNNDDSPGKHKNRYIRIKLEKW